VGGGADESSGDDQSLPNGYLRTVLQPGEDRKSGWGGKDRFTKIQGTKKTQQWENHWLKVTGQASGCLQSAFNHQPGTGEERDVTRRKTKGGGGGEGGHNEGALGL